MYSINATNTPSVTTPSSTCPEPYQMIAPTVTDPAASTTA